MQRRNLKKRIQKSVALASMAAFLTMPGSFVQAATSITAGSSAIGSATGINTSGNITTITTNFIKGNTGVNHFGNFNVGSGHTANFVGANKYVNLIDTKANINGIVNLYKGNAAGGFANAMFISPEGMAIGTGGVLNVASLQMLTPSTNDYTNMLTQAGAAGVTEDNLNTIFNMNSVGDSAKINIDGKINALGDVVIKAGNGIYFGPQGIIDTTGELVNGSGDISLFVNSGEILGKDTVHLDSAGNITMEALGIAGPNKYVDNSVVGEASVAPFNIKIADGKVLNVKVADSVVDGGAVQGYASITNNDSSSLTLGDVQGSDITITNKGYGVISVGSDITDVDKIYLNAENGGLDVSANIKAKNIIRLNGKVFVDSLNDLEVTDAGYISVYSSGVEHKDADGKIIKMTDGDIYVKNAKLKSGNIDIKSAAGNVEVGDIIISERGPAEGVLGLKDNKTLSVGEKAPDMYRFDGVFVEATNGSVSQLSGTQITSAGKVDLTADKSVDAVVKAHDMISAHSNRDVNLDLLDTARLGEIKASVLNVTGDEILVDGMINAGVVDIVAIDKVTVRPRLALDEANGHYTYGAIKGVADVNIVAQNGIFAATEKTDAPMISSQAGNVNLASVGNIGDGIKISVAAGNAVNAEAANVNLFFTGENGNVGNIVAGEYVDIAANGNLNRALEDGVIKAGEDLSIASQNGNVGAADKYLNVSVGGIIEAQAPNGSVYIGSNEALTVLNAVAGQDVALSSSDAVTISKIDAGNNALINSDKDIVVATVKAGQDVEISTKGNVDVANIVQSGNDLTVEADGYINQTLDKTALKSGENMTLKSANNNVGDPNKYLQVEVGGLLDATASNGGVYIYGNSDLSVLNAIAGQDVVIETPNNLAISKAQAGNDIVLNSDNKVVVATGKAGNDVNINAVGDVVIANVLEAGNDLSISADGNIHQTVDAKTSLKSGENMNLKSSNNNVGDPNKYLHVEVGGLLDAAAPNGGVYIYGNSDLSVLNAIAGKDVGLKSSNDLTVSKVQAGNDVLLGSDKKVVVATAKAANDVKIDVIGDVVVGNIVEAGNNLSINADGNVHQTVDGKVSFKSGKNMSLNSAKNNVGDPNKYLQVEVGGQLDAAAPNGGVYIGSKNNLTVGQVVAGKDVEIVADGFIHQTDNGARPAIIAGEDLKLLSNNDNVGDPNNYLTVQVGEKLNAQAPNGGVYIYGYGDLVTDTVIAGGDIGLGGNGDIIIPHDKVDGNIIAGGNVKIEAGDSVVNAGGTEVGIVAGGDIDVSANHNLKDGSVGKLPYNDLAHSINVTLNGEVRADEIGIADSNKILNIHIMGQEIVPDAPSDSEGTIELDDRDQRNMKYLASDDNNSASVRNNRQHLRYNVNNSEYLLMNSSTDSGAKVQDILNISKQGMLVQTDEVAKVGEKIKVTMDYKGLPFTVEGKVVRTDAVNKTAGIEFTNVDRMTSSLILYLGMMNGR